MGMDSTGTLLRLLRLISHPSNFARLAGALQYLEIFKVFERCPGGEIHRGMGPNVKEVI
jgi:hypothetical protein